LLIRQGFRHERLLLLLLFRRGPLLRLLLPLCFFSVKPHLPFDGFVPVLHLLVEIIVQGIRYGRNNRPLLWKLFSTDRLKFCPKTFSLFLLFSKKPVLTTDGLVYRLLDVRGQSYFFTVLTIGLLRLLFLRTFGFLGS